MNARFWLLATAAIFPGEGSMPFRERTRAALLALAPGSGA